MKRYLYIVLMVLPLALTAQNKGTLDIPPDKVPNTPTIRVRRTVVDTVKARAQFETVAPKVYADVLKSEKRQQRCEQLIKTSQKQVTAPADLSLLSDAYDHTMMHHPEYRKEVTDGSYNTAIGYMMKDGVYDMTTIEYDADVQKGVLSKNVRTYLKFYNDFLTDSISNARAYIERNWMQYLDSIPTRKVVREEKNPYYEQHKDN